MSLQEYIQGLNDFQKGWLEEIIQLVKTECPEAELVMAWGIPSFKLKTYLLHVGFYQQHMGLYPGSQAIQACQSSLSDYVCRKGTIRVFYHQPLPKTLIGQLIQFNLKRQ